MRKLIVFLIAVILLFATVGCSKKADPSDLPDTRYIGEIAQDWVKIGPCQKATADGMLFSSLGGHMEGKKFTASVEVSPSISLHSAEFSLIKAALSLEYTDTSVELYGVNKSVKSGQSIQFFYSVVYKIYEATMQDAKRTRYICKVPGQETIVWGYQLFDSGGKVIEDTTIGPQISNLNPNIPLGAKQFCDDEGYHFYVRYGVDSRDFWEAYDYCKVSGGHLVSISSKAENDFVFDTFCKGKTAYDPPYIGIWYDQKDGWSNEFAEYKNWDSGKPSNAFGEECGAFSDKFNGKWSNVANYTSGAFICEWDIRFEDIQ